MTCHSIELRYEPQPDDPAAVRRLAESTDVFSAVEIEVAGELVEDRLKRGAKSDYRFVFADHGGDVAAYTCHGPIPLTAHSFDLYWIVVGKTFQGGGIGRMLLEETERLIRAEGARLVYAETSGRDAYASTREFYRRCGYREEARLKDFYTIGDDKVFFVKRLS